MTHPRRRTFALITTPLLVAALAAPTANATPNTSPGTAGSTTASSAATYQRPYIPTATVVKKRKGPDTRVVATSVGPDSIRLVSNRPVTVKLRLVKTGKKHQIQKHSTRVRVTPKGRVVDDLISGRTYQVILPGGKRTRITPMARVADVAGVQARFTEIPATGTVNVEHIRTWAQDMNNLQYRFTIRTYRPQPAGKQTRSTTLGAVTGVTVTNTPTSEIPLPETGYVQIDAVAVNPLGASTATFYSQVPVEDAWAANGAGGSLLIAATPPAVVDVADITTAPTDETVSEAVANVNRAAGEAVGARDGAQRAAGEAAAAVQAGDPEAAQAAANRAHDEAAKAAGAAWTADQWKNQIPGDTYNAERVAAEQSVRDANSAAEAAAGAAATASGHAVQAWRDEAVRTMVQLRDTHTAYAGTSADTYATERATRARYAATQAARETARINPTTYPDLADRAALSAAEADEAAAAAEALSQMVGAREDYVRAAVDATTPDAARAAADAAREHAGRARTLSDSITATSTHQQVAESAAIMAEEYASAANVAAEDVLHRYNAQQEAVSASTNWNDSSQALLRTRTSLTSATAMGHAQASNTYAGAAETDAAESAEQAGMVTDTSDERPAADQAASEAAAAAVLARANSDDAMRHVTNMTAGEAKTQHDLADTIDDSAGTGIYADAADQLADRAWGAVDLIDDANTEDLAAATERANVTQAYADLANIYEEETRQRELAQTANEESASQLQQAAETATAEQAYAFLLEARAQATAAEAARDAIAASIADREATFGPDARVNDQLARAEAAAQQARANALAAEQYALPTQEMLNEELAVDAASLIVTPGGDTQITFAKNPNDTRAVLRYSAHANGIPGVLTDNGDGTITVAWQGLPIASDGYTFTVVPAGINDERVSTNHTTYAPSAVSPASLSDLITMREASVMEVCGETPGAPGTMENGECVGTKPLAYDRVPVVYDSRPRTGRNVKVGETPGGACNYLPNPNSPTGLDIYCPPPNPVYEWRWDPTPSGYAVVGNNWVATEPNSPTRDPRIDSAFSDKTWLRDGNQWLAVSPLPAADFNTTVTYTYEAGKGTYVTRNAPAISKTFAPTFTSLPNGVIAWTATSSTGQAGTYTGLDGDDTGRFTPTITVHTIGGDVIVPAPNVNGVAADQ